MEGALAEDELQIAVQDALTKAFRSNHTKARSAYIDLATFFSSQLVERHGKSSLQHAIRFR